MKTKNIFWAFLIVVAFILLLDSEAMAQCAMCRANVKTNLNNGDEIGGVGHSLNNAILYLMAVPYLLVSSLIYVFNKERIDAWLAVKWNAFRRGSKPSSSSVEA
jgi:Na+/H+ antiporter NhaC